MQATRKRDKKARSTIVEEKGGNIEPIYLTIGCADDPPVTIIPSFMFSYHASRCQVPTGRAIQEYTTFAY